MAERVREDPKQGGSWGDIYVSEQSGWNEELASELEKEKQAFLQSAKAQIAAVDLEKLAAQNAEIDRLFAAALENFRVQQGEISKTIEEMAAAARKSYVTVTAVPSEVSDALRAQQVKFERVVGSHAEQLRQALEQGLAGDITEKEEQAFLLSADAQVATVDLEKLAAQTAEIDRRFAAALETFHVQQGGISKTIEEMAAAARQAYVTVTAVPPEVSDALRAQQHEFERVVGAYSEKLRQALEQPLAQGDVVEERIQGREGRPDRAKV